MKQGPLRKTAGTSFRWMAARMIESRLFQRQVWHSLLGATVGPLPETLRSDEARFLAACCAYADISRAQRFQDVWVALESNFKEGGYFVEFGATDGLTLSNTALLERSLRWNGVLAEPNPDWHPRLRANRTAAIDHRAVWEQSGQSLELLITSNAELATLDVASNADLHEQERRDTAVRRETVETISLDDLLRQHRVPIGFDYLSVDTEGSEYMILKSFALAHYRPRLVSVEHNFTEARNAIHQLMRTHGYLRVLERFSGQDDWYRLDERTSTADLATARRSGDPQ